jgi:hypothetical protein
MFADERGGPLVKPAGNGLPFSPWRLSFTLFGVDTLLVALVPTHQRAIYAQRLQHVGELQQTAGMTHGSFNLRSPPSCTSVVSLIFRNERGDQKAQ